MVSEKEGKHPGFCLNIKAVIHIMCEDRVVGLSLDPLCFYRYRKKFEKYLDI